MLRTRHAAYNHHTLSLHNPALPNNTDVLPSDECADDLMAAFAGALPQALAGALAAADASSNW